MVLNNINPQKRNEILNFFKEKFNIDLEKYDEEEIHLIVNEIKSTINKTIIKEKIKYNELSSKLQKECIDTLFLLY